MGRKRAREDFFKLLFEADMKEKLPAEIVERFIENYPEVLEDEEKLFLRKYAENISLKYDTVNQVIEKNMKNWRMDRIGTVERVLLRFATYEILAERDLGYRIAVNEALELAKKYGEDKSHEFINGVLANIISGDNA